MCKNTKKVDRSQTIIALICGIIFILQPLLKWHKQRQQTRNRRRANYATQRREAPDSSDSSSSFRPTPMPEYQYYMVDDENGRGLRYGPVNNEKPSNQNEKPSNIETPSNKDEHKTTILVNPPTSASDKSSDSDLCDLTNYIIWSEILKRRF